MHLPGRGGDRLSRPSPIVTGAVLLALLVVGGGLALFVVRFRSRAEVVPSEVASEAGPVSPPLPRPEPPSPALATTAPPTPDAAAVSSTSAALRRRDLLVAAHLEQVI